jgi:diguanylate cyclase (GGDEF)-like protein
MRRPFSLQASIQVLIAAIVFTLGAVILVGLSVLSSRQIDDALRRDARTSDALLTQLLNQRAQSLSDQCTLFVRQPAVRMVIGTGDIPTVSDSMKDYLKQLDADGVIVSDSRGRYLGGAGSSTPPFGLLAGGIRSAMGGTIWLGLVQADGRIMQAVTVPVYNGETLWGTFTAVQSLDDRLALQLSQTVGSEVAFVSDGHIVASSLPLAESPSGQDGVARLITINRIRYFALSSPLIGSGAAGRMSLVTLNPYDREMAAYNSLRDVFLTVLCIGLLVASALGALLARGMTRPLDGVVRAARKIQGGEWPEPIVQPGSDEIVLLQSVFNEMTRKLRSDQERLESLIDTDPLTGLRNHRRFQERLAEETRRSSLSGEALVVLICDFDHFHAYNQRHGHAAGDEALQTLAKVLRESLPEIAVLARYGGEEFSAILPGVESGEVGPILDKLLETCRLTFASKLTISIGLAEFGVNADQADTLMLAAELALSRAKQLGRDRASRFDADASADEAVDPFQLQRFLKDGTLATIQALAAAVDAKDPYTRGHSANVAEYAGELAGILRYPNDLIELIRVTGTLHDVGKIGVPDAILKKPGRLTPEEREIMETHPVLGEVIVKKAPQLAPTLPGVRNHHERWDGAGYPDKISGEAIPLIARVLAVADTFDAMTSDRPYRKGLPIEVALAEIENGAGSQFDPVLAKAFVEMMRSRNLQKAA